MVNKILHIELESSNNGRQIVKLALLFSALHDCSESLLSEYTNAINGSIQPDPERETWHLPSPSAVLAGANSQLGNIKFVGKLNRENEPLVAHAGSLEPWEMRPLFLATRVVEKDEVIVKFTDRYNAEAHRDAAKEGYAPRLYFDEEVIGGLTMVVMERLDGKPMSERVENSLPPSVFEDIENALKFLHAKNIVFGDLRAANVIIVGGKKRERAKLIDFDWPAPEGKGLYPATINRILFETAAVFGGGVMRAKHDWFGLWRLVDRYCNDAKYREEKCSQLDALRR